jgi:hypothetical protein
MCTTGMTRLADCTRSVPASECHKHRRLLHLLEGLRLRWTLALPEPPQGPPPNSWPWTSPPCPLACPEGTARQTVGPCPSRWRAHRVAQGLLGGRQVAPCLGSSRLLRGPWRLRPRALGRGLRLARLLRALLFRTRLGGRRRLGGRLFGALLLRAWLRRAQQFRRHSVFGALPRGSGARGTKLDLLTHAPIA